MNKILNPLIFPKNFTTKRSLKEISRGKILGQPIFYSFKLNYFRYITLFLNLTLGFFFYSIALGVKLYLIFGKHLSNIHWEEKILNFFAGAKNFS